MPPQAAIIKVNGSMVTIRSPALQQALNANHQHDPDSMSDQGKKKKKKKKCANGQGHNEDSWNIDGELPRPVVPPWLMYIMGKWRVETYGLAL